MGQLDDWLTKSSYGEMPDIFGTGVPDLPDSVLEGDINKELDEDDELNFSGQDETTKRQTLINYINSLLNNPDILKVRDRSDIINPEQILNRITWGTDAESVALYNKYLQALRNLQAQQESAYQEWYNSTLQQAQRDQLAGLNTDLLGISGNSLASQSDVGSSNPYDGLPTSEEIAIQKAQVRNQRIANLISSIGTVANLGSSFAGIGKTVADFALSRSQKVAQDISNIQSFEDLAGSEIASRLSDSIGSAVSAGQSLDINEWFSNPENTSGILETYQPTGVDYSRSFSNVRNRIQRNLGQAYENGKVTAENQSNFAAIAADPRYSADVLVQMAQLKPYMEARLAMQMAQDEYNEVLANWNKEYQKALSSKNAVDFANNQNEYQAEYFKELEAKKMAAYETYIKQAEAIRSQMRSAIDSNLMAIYKANPNNQKGFAAAYMFDNAGLAWYEYLGAALISTDMQGFERPSSPSASWNGVEIPSTNPPSFTGASPSPSAINGFIPPYGIRY